MKKIIYDFGSNNGDDIPYYLMKSELVIAVEANPNLCELIRKRFSSEIQQGKLVVENAVLTNINEPVNVDFYIHKKCHVLSQFPKPDKNIESFEVVRLPSVNPVSLIHKYGEPHYIKIDIEHFDAEILRCIFSSNIYPDYISAESHSAEVLSVLIALGGYDAFKIVEGSNVSYKYRDRVIQTITGSSKEYSFPFHSAGPYGPDIDGEWLSADCILRKVGFFGYGWIDIHAARNEFGKLSYSFGNALKDVIMEKVYRRWHRLLNRLSRHEL